MKLLRHTFRIMRRRPWVSAMILIGMILSSLGQIASLASTYPALQIVMGDTSGDPRIGRLMTRALEWAGIEPGLTMFLLFSLLIGVSFASISILFDRRQQAFYRDHEIGMRHDLILAIFHSNWRHISSLSHGDVANIVLGEVDLYKTVVKVGLAILNALFQVGAMMGFALWLHWKFSLAALGMFALGGSLSMPFFYLTALFGRRRVVWANKFSSKLLDELRASKTIKACSLENTAVGSLDALNSGLAHTTSKTKMVGAYQARLNDVVGLALVIGLIYFGHEVFRMDTSALLILMALFARVLPVIRLALSFYNEGMTAMPSVEAVDRWLLAARQNRQRMGGDRFQAPFQRLAFDRVTFIPPGSAAPLLNDFSFTLSRGEFLLIAGPTGSGKTTILDLILGLFSPQSGGITIDGMPLDRMDLQSWHSRAGFLSQQNFVFEGTLRENLLWSMDTPPSDERLLEAAKRARLGKLLDGSCGLDMAVLESGNNLSGGEKQRLALARLFLRDADLLIFDEPTSALDKETEGEIMDVLCGLKGKATVIVVSHESRFRELCDRVIDLRPKTPADVSVE